MSKYVRCLVVILSLVGLLATASRPAAADVLELKQGDSICLVGNALAERMQHFGHFETRLQTRFPQLQLSVRNLGYSADEPNLMPRSKDFGTMRDHLAKHEADVVLAFFGFNESFAGAEGVDDYRQVLADFVDRVQAKEYGDGGKARLVLVSPIAFEDLGDRNLPNAEDRNADLKLYTDAMREVAAEKQVGFADLFTPSLTLFAENNETEFTFNGCHLTDSGYAAVAPLLETALFGAGAPLDAAADSDRLRQEIRDKNFVHWHNYRAIDGFYIYGGRSQLKFENADSGKTFVNAPVMEREREIFAGMADLRDQRIWALAQGKTVPAVADDSGLPSQMPVETNYNRRIEYLSPEEAITQFELAPGYEINLYASEVEFPELMNPVQMSIDARGRIWVTTMPSYPQILPGDKQKDRILIYEDTDGDGRADKQTVFADDLHVPTGIELGDGGAYVATQPDITFLKDTDGDDVADVRERILHGFDTADSHHSISAFTWGPGGELYFQEGTFHHSQVEGPWGPTRLKNAGIYRYEPRSRKLDVFVSYGFANPWGHTFDDWGQNFVADASGGANYFAAAFSTHVEYPRKLPQMRQFFNRQWRPTAGCEFVSSRQFPEEAQGRYLLNNCIGFLGILQYDVKDDGAGFRGVPVPNPDFVKDEDFEKPLKAYDGGKRIRKKKTVLTHFNQPYQPLLRSVDPNFRPCDLEFGADGALYVVDWQNPLVGHMQHHVRDPNRDHSHGRIWRITYKGRPLVESPQIAGASISQLLDALKTYEYRIRYRARRELRLHDTDQVVAETEKWLASLDPSDERYEHHRLEALWVYQHVNVVNPSLLESLLFCPDYRTRAAATRVLCYWRDRVENPLALLTRLARDEHPRVRLEAVRAASFFKEAKAAKVALLVGAKNKKDKDYYIDYTYKATMETLKPYLLKKK